MTPDEIKNEILSFLSEEIDFDEITNVESNCGSLWIDLKDGTTKSISITDCEPA